MADQFKLKAFVRIDGTGKVIPGGPIFQAQKPKVGKWREISVKECCNYVPTSTTTTSSTSSTTSTSTSTSTSTTSTTTTAGVPRYYIRYNTLGDQGLVYRYYTTNPNVYYSLASSSSSQVYFSGTLGIGTQLFFDQALTDPVMGNYTFSYTSTPSSYNVNANDVFYTLEGSYITGIVGTGATLAWNQFTSSGVQNDLVACNAFYPNDFALAPGVTALAIGVTVYNGVNNPFSSWNYLTYGGTVYVLTGGSTVLSTQPC